MQNVLADLCIDSEAATLTAMRLARSFDEGSDDDAQAAFKRLATAVSKYWICKSATWHVAEALECLGGNGYVEDSGMPRLYRETPLNSIWEGSGNVNCLDVLRAMAKSPETVESFIAEVEGASSASPELAAHLDACKRELTNLEDVQVRARSIVESLALALQAAVLVRNGDPVVAEAFCRTRLNGRRGRAYGTLPPGIDFAAIIERHRPVVSRRIA
jgi:putative acyl-CoA dehydrogenase